ncbi:MAG: CTP pyrophosphohydrolase [Hyphomonas sp. TMED17]|nr:MAG: CTP pyrophosphohydrolase [Hyphomonas sp. TMED17]
MMKTVLVSAAALINEKDQILLAQRPDGKSMAGLWEFPGGKIEIGETAEAALVRELREELSIQVEIPDLHPIAFASYQYETFYLLMPLFEIRHWRGALVPTEGQKLSWVAADKLDSFPAPAADIPLFDALKQRFAARAL